MRSGWVPVALAVIGAAVLLAGCGSTSHTKSTSTTAEVPTTAPRTVASTRPAHPQAPAASSPGALLAEATSVAAGDIPDNQVFIAFRNARSGYSLKYPEGWAQQGAGARVAFRDKNNVVRIVVASASLPSAAAIRRELAGLRGVTLRSSPRPVVVGGARGFKVVYATRSAPNPVTGKRVTLVVDRYYLAHAGKQAVVDLGTPEGVDNVDAYRLMIESFRWR